MYDEKGIKGNGGTELSETPKIRVPSADTPWGQEVIEFALSYCGDDPEGVRNPDHLHGATESPLLASERAAARNR